MFALLLPAIALASLSTTSPGVQHRYEALSLSSDAKQIASVESVRQANATTEEHGAVVIRDADGGVHARLDPCAACRYTGPAWSPDGKSLAFVASAGGVATLYVTTAGTTRVLTELHGLVASPRWSPDGRTIAVLATAGARKETGAREVGARQIGEIGENDDSQRIATVDAAGGELKFVSADHTFVYEYDWTRDSRGFVATAAQGNGDNNWWVAKIQAFALDGTARVIAAPAVQMNYPRTSPDGRKVAFIGGLMSDFGSVGGDIYTVDVGGGEPMDITPGFKGSFTSIAWRGNRLVAAVVVGGETGTAVVDPAGAQVTNLRLQPATFEAGDGGIALDKTGRRAAYVSEAFDHAPRIEYGALGEAKPITHDNDGLKPATVARDINWKNEGLSVQGWLLAPLDAQPNKTYPMIVVVHGGPAAAVTPHFVWDDNTAGWLRNGYYVFQPNPRGSFGQGAAFTRANVRDFGGGDLRDILAGVDAVQKAAPIDSTRLGIYGRSYGGFMTMWVVTHSQRFKAAAAGAGLGDWMAYYGQNGIDQWMIPYFGASAYDDPEIYDRLSPIRSIKAVRTPTFLYVGERDVETPTEQTREFWHGLRSVGVPTSLVIYADEGHRLRKPENVEDLNRRLIGWFDRYLK
jgi:dipeptidyl aminopeptidase/acylaminoacyl peptidase